MIANPFTFQERMALNRIFSEYGTAVYWNDGEFLVDEDFTDIDLERLAEDMAYEGFHYPVHFAHESLLKGKRLVRSARKPSEVLQEKRHMIFHVLDKYHMRNPRIFGSTARGEDSVEENSDLDILISGKYEYNDIQTAKKELENILEVPVDLSVEEYLKTYLKDEVTREAIKL